MSRYSPYLGEDGKHWTQSCVANTHDHGRCSDYKESFILHQKLSNLQSKIVFTENNVVKFRLKWHQFLYDKVILPDDISNLLAMMLLLNDPMLRPALASSRAEG